MTANEFRKKLADNELSTYPPKGDAFTQEVLEKYYSAGAIKKADLVDGATYKGTCRNAEEAVWCEKDQTFTYMRTKFHLTFPEGINHLEDDNGYDLFIPFERVEK